MTLASKIRYTIRSILIAAAIASAIIGSRSCGPDDKFAGISGIWYIFAAPGLLILVFLGEWAGYAAMALGGLVGVYGIVGWAGPGLKETAITVGLGAGLIVAGILLKWVGTGKQFEYFCADCDQFLGRAASVCPRCGCNRWVSRRIS